MKWRHGGCLGLRAVRADHRRDRLCCGANRWRLAGAYLDPTGLYKIGQRYYHPDWGRWTQPDPILAPLDPVNCNRYAYAGNNPTNYTDPTGLFSFGCFFNEFFGIGWQHTPESEGTGGGSSGPSIRPTFNGTAAVQFAAGNLWSFTAKRVAAELRKRWLSRLVPYVGWGFTAFSAYKSYQKCK